MDKTIHFNVKYGVLPNLPDKFDAKIRMCLKHEFSFRHHDLISI